MLLFVTVNVLSLKDNSSAWLQSEWITPKSMYKVTGLCLLFTYKLTSPSSVLKVFGMKGHKSQSVQWSVEGYHGPTWLEARVTWPTDIKSQVLTINDSAFFPYLYSYLVAEWPLEIRVNLTAACRRV